MRASRELKSAEYLTSDSPETDTNKQRGNRADKTLAAGEERRGRGIQRQESDFGFIDLQHQQDTDVSEEVEEQGGESSKIYTVDVEEGTNSAEDHLRERQVISAASLNFRASTVLTEKIIAEIAASIKVFRPSRSLHQLIADRNEVGDSDCSTPTVSIDLVVSGGGLKGYFVCGCVSVLQRQLASHNIHIARVSGASAGAWSGFFICTGITTAMWMESYYKCYDNPHRTIHEVYEEEMWPIVREQLAPDAYQSCSGRLHISITVVRPWGRLENLVISEFLSNEDLFECCLASSTIPYITERGAYRLFRGMRVIDGGLTNNTPVFRDGTRRQLVFRLSQIEYPWRLLINPVDTCIDALVIRGALQMSRFLSGEPVPAIAWLEQKQGESDLIRPGHSIRRVVAPAAALSLICFRTSFLPYLVDCLAYASATGTAVGSSLSINFSDADSVFQTHPFFYACGTAFAAVVSLLRRMQMLL